MSNPRIYIAIATFLPLVGGAEKQALAQGRSLRERGFETTIITFRHDRTWSPRDVIEGVPILRVAGVLLGGREKLPRPLQKLLYLIAIVIMCWTLWQHRKSYDVLHVYQLSVLALPTALVCRLTGTPMIIAIRSAGSGSAKSHMSLVAGPLDVTTPWLQIDGQSRADGDLEWLERMGKPAVRFIRSLLQRNHAVVIILSSRMKNYLAAHNFNLPATQLIPNGVDTTRFHPLYPDTSTDERAQVVVCVSKLRYEKGIDVLLQAWYLVQKQLPQPSQARLIIVGDGPLQTQLECMAQALGIVSSVEFVGLQSDIAAQLHRGNLAVLPSRFEGMPNALLEAMACGSACVATRVSGSEDIIQHGVNGLLVESEDYQGMAQALFTLLRNPALAQQYGHLARAIIEKHYSLEHITDMYVELYQRITDHRPKNTEDIQASEIYHLPS